MGGRGTPLACDVLGPLQARRNGDAVRFASNPQQVLFAILALHANVAIGRDQLIDLVWGTSAPAYAVNLVQKRISELRQVLQPDRSTRASAPFIRWTDRGYLLDLPGENLDLWRHQQALQTAHAERTRGDLDLAVATIRSALDLWRGPAFEGLSSPLLDLERERLAETRITTIEDRIELELALGGDLDLVPELRRLIAEHPLRERLRGLLMLSLYRAGRQSDALSAYDDVRQYLADELGLDPGADLQRLRQRILQADPLLAGRDSGAMALQRRTERAVPAELPHALALFAGRQSELDRLDALLGENDASNDMLLMTITGTAGVGKTTLAVHWAHQVKHRYPDGQLYVNLRGFDPSGATLESADAVRAFLDALTSSAGRYPVDLDAQAALFRTLMAGRRMLILLDNAASAEQVRPLLPGTPGCLVVVTSRDQLTGLAATDGADTVNVDLLSAEDARTLLRRRLGTGRVAAEPVAIDKIIGACAGLPLALTIAAAQAAAYDQFPLQALVTEMEDAGVPLDAFSGDDEPSDVRAVFSWSYDRLSVSARRLFRLLGVHPASPDISLAAAASLAGIPLDQIRSVLHELTKASLLTKRGGGRYVLHDLLRAYATELAQRDLSPLERSAAVDRCLDFYLHSAHLADQLLDIHRDDPIELPPPVPRTTPVEHVDAAQAAAWFGSEHESLIAAVRQGVELGLDRQVWLLSSTLPAYLEFSGHWHDAVLVLEAGVAAARRIGGESATATALNLLGRAYCRLTRYSEAAARQAEALGIAAEIGDLVNQAQAHHGIALLMDRQGRYRRGLHQAEQALHFFRAAGGHPVGEGRALNAVGWFHMLLGDEDRGRAFCTEALDLQRRSGHILGQAETLDSLGYGNFRTADYAASIRCYGQAIRLYEQLGDKYNVADTQVSLGDALLAAGDAQSARAEWQDAVATLEQLGHSDADTVRLRLARLE